MIASSIELQQAIYAVLSTNQTMLELLAVPKNFQGLPAGTKIMLFDKVPDAIMQAFDAGKCPTYATFGDGSERFALSGDPGDEDNTVELTNHVLAYRVWSQAVGFVECKNIALALRKAITVAFNRQQLNLAANTLIGIAPSTVTYERDPRDGFTSCATLIMTALTEPVA